MKMIIAVVKNEDVERLSEQLVRGGFRATKLSSTGGFLGEGNTTLLIGTDSSAVDDVLAIIRRSCSARQKFVSQGSYEIMPMGLTRPIEVTVGGATVFVLGVPQFHKFCDSL